MLNLQVISSSYQLFRHRLLFKGKVQSNKKNALHIIVLYSFLTLLVANLCIYDSNLKITMRLTQIF